MATLAEEEDPIGYRDRVIAYLKKSRSRRLPWGTIVAGGALTYRNGSYEERSARAELGEVAITLLEGLGVSERQINALAEMPFDASPAELVARLVELQSAPEEPAAPVEAPKPEPPPPPPSTGRAHDFGGPACVCGLMPGEAGPVWCPGPKRWP